MNFPPNIFQGIPAYLIRFVNGVFGLVKGNLVSAIFLTLCLYPMKKIFGSKIRIIGFILPGLIIECCSWVAAQSVNPKIDSLQNILRSSDEDSTRFRLHFLIGQLYLKEGVFDSQLVHANAALQLADKISRPTIQQKKFKAGALRLKGIYFRTRGDFDKAIDFYLEALSMFEEIKDSNGQASTINSIGIAYLTLKRYQEAFDYFLQARDLDHILGKPDKETADLLNICNALLGNGLMPDSVNEKALGFARQALALAQQVGDDGLIVRSAEAVATCYRNLRRYDESLRYQQQALQGADSLQQPALLAEQLYQMAQLYHDMKEYDKAIAYGLQSEALSREYLLPTFFFDIYGILASAYAETNNYSKAYEYTKKLNEELDSTYQTQITEQLKRFESEKKDNEIKLLSTKSQLKEKEATQQKQLKNIFIIGAVLLLLLAVVLINRYQIKHRSERELAEKNKIIEKEKQRAEQSEQFKSQFLATMSHEIRTPMNAIMGVTNLLLDEPQNEKNLRYLNVVKHSSGNLLVVINDILDLSKLEAGKMLLEKIPFRIQDVVNSVYDTLQLKAEEKDLKFIIDIDKNIPEVLLGDPARLTQVLLNLVGNAMKFTERGSVTLSVIARNEGKTLSESVTKQSQTISDTVQSEGLLRRPASQSSALLLAMTFSVSDTGIGIEKEKLDSIFQSFTQAHVGDARRYGGTGLGLTISKSLVELLDGTLEVESSPGAGSVFSFTIPFEISSEEEFEKYYLQKDGFSADDLFGLKILLAEDNEHNQLVAVDTLKKVIDDVEIDVVKNGKEVLDSLNRQSVSGDKPYDLILMDVQMPEMDGYEATRQIRNPESGIRNPNIPIIALTASVVRSDLKKCIDAGMNSYIPKPFSKEDLVKEIGKVLQLNTELLKKQVAANTDAEVISPVNDKRIREIRATAKPEDLLLSSGVNFSRLLQVSGNDKEKLKEYLRQFVDLIPSRVEQLKSFSEKNDAEGIYQSAHKLKPQLGFFGMKREELIANTIELKARELSNDELSKLISQVEKGCNLALKEIEIELKRLS